MIEAFAIIAALSAVVGAYSAYTGGQNQKDILQYNAQLQQQQAAQRKKEAEYKVQRMREQNELVKAKQRLAFNVSGVTSEGSPLSLYEDTARRMEMDAMSILYTGDSQAAELNRQATLSRIQGDMAASAGTLVAAQSLLTGASSAYKTYALKDTVRYSKFNSSDITDVAP